MQGKEIRTAKARTKIGSEGRDTRQKGRYPFEAKQFFGTAKKGTRKQRKRSKKDSGKN